jgi:hypothetical protein
VETRRPADSHQIYPFCKSEIRRPHFRRLRRDELPGAGRPTTSHARKSGSCGCSNLTGIRSSFGERGALFRRRPITSSAEGGCPDLDPLRGSGCGAKLICNRLVRLAKTVRLLAPLIAAVRCHSPSSRTKQVRLQLERASPAAQPTSPRHKRSRSSSIGSLKPAGRDTRPDVGSKALRRPDAKQAYRE